MFKTIKNAWKTPELRKKIIYTLILIVIFRLGCYISVPGVDALALDEAMSNSSGIAGLINLISGGAFARFSIFAMSITPYINASIIIQLLGFVIPALEKLTKEGGEEGRQKINKYTKILTLVLALIEGLGLYFTYSKNTSVQVFIKPGFLTGAMVIAGFVAGTSLLIWLGEQITNKGVGNGISMIIFVGIISRMPSALVTMWNLIVTGEGFSTTGFLIALAILIGAIILIAAVVYMQLAERRIPVQYSKRVVGRKMVGAQNTHIPLKLAMAGVMPIIFASAFMTFPAIVISFFNKEIQTATGFWAGVYKFSVATSDASVGVGFTVANAIVYLLLILGFTYFYTYAMMNPAEMSTNIKKNGGFIPGIRAGKPTTEYLSSVISKITLFGGIYLAVIAILPMLLRFTSLNITFGGTAVLIVVGVALETIQQLESQLVMRHYKGFLD